MENTQHPTHSELRKEISASLLLHTEQKERLLGLVNEYLSEDGAQKIWLLMQEYDHLEEEAIATLKESDYEEINRKLQALHTEEERKKRERSEQSEGTEDKEELTELEELLTEDHATE